MSADTVISGAKLAWEIIKDGKPSADIHNSTAAAVPGVSDWMSLSDARGPNVRRMYYHVSFVWPFDDYVHAEFDILLKFQYGARYNGGGAFIPNLWIEVPTCFVAWGWTADINFIGRNPTNAGEAGSPIAALPLTISGSVSSPLETYHVEWGFTAYGNGRVETH
jgi:hypothetical protein